jgi:hypothetical protein
MLESAKERFIGVYPLGKHVLPRVRYKTACLLVRDAVGSVPCSDEWEVHGHSRRPTCCKRGHGTATTPGNLSIAMIPCDTLAKPGI